MEQSQPLAAPLGAAQSELLQHALKQLLSGAPEAAGCGEEALQILRQTAQVSAALRLLQASGGSSCGGRESPAAAADDASASSTHEPPDASAFVGATGCPLGVSAADLLAEELPPEAARRQAMTAVLPALEAVLLRRCASVAAAAGYESTQDFSGLPDHVRQLQAAAAEQQRAAARAEAWRKAAAQAEEAVGVLAEAAALLAGVLRRHKLQGRRDADEAHAAALRSKCVFFREKLRVVQLQLQAATYTADTVPVLRRVAEEVEGALGLAEAQLQQATARLAQYRALGPGFASLAAEYARVLEALEEAEFELREIEQFQALAVVTG